MASSLLFHGPGAKRAACAEVERTGRLLVPPIGDDDNGLKVDQVREAVKLINSIPLGEGKSAVVLGPMDGTATQKSSDALLKTIEEGGSGYVIPILWAHDLGGVTPTIRSRCLDRWSPGEDEGPDEEDDGVVTAAWTAVDVALKRDYAGVISALHILRAKEAKGFKFLKVVSESLSTKVDDPDARKLWTQVRQALRNKQPSTLEVAASLLLEP